MRRFIAALAVSGLALAGCGTSTTTGTTATSDAPTATEQDLQTKPEFTVDTTQAPPATLVIEDLVVGDGDEAVAGSTISVHYVGKTLSTGVEFDSSWDRGQPFVFSLGAGQVIAGWDQGFAGMKIGGRRMLTIPADMAYGNQSPSPAIPAGSTLVFVVDLLAVN